MMTSGLLRGLLLSLSLALHAADAALVVASSRSRLAATARSVRPVTARSLALATAADDAAVPSIAEGEREVSKAYVRLNAATDNAEKAELLQQLQQAQAALAELRAADRRDACQRSIASCADGEEAAGLLEELRTAGIPPGAACYHAALRACGGGGGGSGGEWAALLYDEMAVARVHDAKAAALALRACVEAAAWNEAAELLAASDADECPPKLGPLLEALRRVPHGATADGDGAASALGALHLRLGEQLAAQLPSLWDAATLQIALPVLPAPEAVPSLLLGALECLAAAQLEAGPARSVVGEPVKLVVAASGAGADDARDEEREEAWQSEEEVRREPPRVVARRAEAMLLERLSVAGQPFDADELGLREVLLGREGGEGGGAVLMVQQAAEEWVRRRCTQMWLEQARVAAMGEAELRLEEARAQQQRRRREADAAQARERRQQAWELRNERAAEELQMARRAEQTSLGAAIDDMLVRQVERAGLTTQQVEAQADAERQAKLDEAAAAASTAGAKGAAPKGRREQLQAAAAQPAAQAVLQEPGPRSAPPPSPAAPPAAAGASGDAAVSTVRGIGPKRATQLTEAGVATVAALAGLTAAQEERLAAEHGLPLKTLRAAAQTARELMQGG